MTGIARISLLSFLLLLAGCAQKATVAVDAIGVAHPEQRYVILPGMPDVRSDDLQFTEYKGHLARLMAGLGYKLADTRQEATAAVLLSYGVSGGAQPYYQEDPRVGVGVGLGSGGGYYNSGSFFGLGLGFSQPYGGSPPSPQYIRRIVLDAVDLSTAKGPDTLEGVTSLWKVTLTSAGQSENMRYFFPAILQSAGPYIGHDTHGPVTVTLENGS